MGGIVCALFRERCTDHPMQAQNPSTCRLGRWNGTQIVKANPIREDGMLRVHPVGESASHPATPQACKITIV